MSSITIHAIDTKLDERLAEEARRNKKSKNQLVKDLLSHSLGLSTGGTYADDYGEFCGEWTIHEKQAFDVLQEDNSRTDPGDWQE